MVGSAASYGGFLGKRSDKGVRDVKSAADMLRKHVAKASSASAYPSYGSQDAGNSAASQIEDFVKKYG
jgi:hypothetical protein